MLLDVLMRRKVWLIRNAWTALSSIVFQKSYHCFVWYKWLADVMVFFQDFNQWWRIEVDLDSWAYCSPILLSNNFNYIFGNDSTSLQWQNHFNIIWKSKMNYTIMLNRLLKNAIRLNIELIREMSGYHNVIERLLWPMGT